MDSRGENFLISVIMPVYNVAPFLREAIQSVLDQTLPNIELILINDGSTDESAQICTSFKQNYPDQLTYISKENEGVSIARNLGLAHAKGAYVFFMDSDDTISADLLASTYRIAIEQNSDVSVMGDYYYKRMKHVRALPTWALVIRRSFLLEYPEVRFSPQIQPGEDGLFTHQVLLLAKNISYNRKGVYSYRQHAQQNHVTSLRQNDKILKQIPQWMDILDDFYKRHQLQQTKAMELALFVEHEPFEFRFKKMEWTDEQKLYLYSLIKDYMNIKVFPYLSRREKNKLQPIFLALVNSLTYTQFEVYFQQRERRGNFYLSLADLIPFRGIKRKILRNITKNFF